MAPVVEDVDVGDTLTGLLKTTGGQIAILAYSTYQPDGKLAFNLAVANDPEASLKSQIDTLEQVIRALFFHHKRLASELNNHRIVLPGRN